MGDAISVPCESKQSMRKASSGARPCSGDEARIAVELDPGELDRAFRLRSGDHGVDVPRGRRRSPPLRSRARPRRAARRSRRCAARRPELPALDQVHGSVLQLEPRRGRPTGCRASSRRLWRAPRARRGRRPAAACRYSSRAGRAPPSARSRGRSRPVARRDGDERQCHRSALAASRQVIVFSGLPDILRC